MKEHALLKQQIARINNAPGTAYGLLGSGGTATRVYQLDDLLVTLGGYSPENINLYMDLLTESAVFSPWSKQAGEIVSRPYYVQPGDDTPAAQQAADFIRGTLDNLGVDGDEQALQLLQSDADFIGLQKWLLTAVITGLAPIEVVYKKSKQGLKTIDKLILLAPDRILFDETVNGQIVPRLRTAIKSSNGLRLPAKKFVLHRYWAMPTPSPYGQGLGRQLYWPVKWKHDALSLWMQIANKHADPTVIGVAPERATQEELKEFYSDLLRFSASGTMALRKGYDVRTPSVPGSGVDWLQGLCDYSDKMCALVLLGEATTGEQTGGSQAREEINNNIRLQKAKEYSDSVLGSLNNTLVSWLCDLNFPGVAKPKLKRDFWDVTTVLQHASSLDLLGIKLDRNFLEQVTGYKFQPPKVRQPAS